MPLLEIPYYSLIVTLATCYTFFLVLLLRGTREHPYRLQEKAVSTVTLVIPTYNEARIISRKLDNTLQLDFPSGQLQVMVVDSGSTDETRTIVKEFTEKQQDRLKVVLLEQPTRNGKSGAINEALGHIDSEIFAITDADVTLRPDALRRLVSNFGDPEIGAASGVEVPVETGSLWGKIERGYRTVYTSIRMAEADLDTPFMCESEFSAYRRKIVRPLRDGCMCDDVELTLGVRSKGVRAAYDLGVPFLEQEADTLGSKFRHKLRRGMANQHALLRNRTVLFNKGFGKYGRTIFPFEFFVHIVSPILITAALAILLLLIITSPASAILAIFMTILLALPSIAIIYQMIRRYGGKEGTGFQIGNSWALGVTAFLAFQVALIGSLLQLGANGPELRWAKIAETRM